MKKTLIFCVLSLVLTLMPSTGFSQENTAPQVPADNLTPRETAEKDFSYLLGMEGFSDEILTDHFKLYGGYVNNSKKIQTKLSELLDEKKTNTPEYAELKRRLGWEMNGAKLHEYYFENLGGNGVIEAESDLYKEIEGNFGSFERWKEDFISTGAMRGIGWVILYREADTGKLVNSWIDEHAIGHFSGWEALLVMDVFEHAYMTDYRLDRAGYMKVFFSNIDWQTVEKRVSRKESLEVR